jgi:methylated-DNA-protein-cysteine methyltransferase-like protein
VSAFAEVWALVKRIPRGRVATYGQLSNLIGKKLTPVGIGWALRAAPEDSIPWQRVVNASGGMSTEAEHPGLQRAMLESEGVEFDGDIVDLATYQWKPRVTAASRPRPRTRRPTRTRRRSG